MKFLGIQESKLEVVDLFVARSFGGNPSFHHAFSPSRGASGGIIVIWNPDVISQTNVIISGYFVVVESNWMRSGLDFMFIVVYAPQDANLKRAILMQIL